MCKCLCPGLTCSPVSKYSGVIELGHALKNGIRLTLLLSAWHQATREEQGQQHKPSPSVREEMEKKLETGSREERKELWVVVTHLGTQP